MKPFNSYNVSSGGGILGSLSDTLLGTTFKQQAEMNNQVLMNQYLAKNSPSWNKQGMINAGINPLLNSSGDFSSVSGSTGSGGSGTSDAIALIGAIGSLIKLIL